MKILWDFLFFYLLKKKMSDLNGFEEVNQFHNNNIFYIKDNRKLI